MSNYKAVSNEEIIAALLQHGTVKEAAAAAGLSVRAIYDRMSERDFKAAYLEAKNDIIRKAVYSINEKLAAAVDAVADIMSDQDINPDIRLKAAQTILKYAGSFAERLSFEEQRSMRLAQDPFEI